jgi:hypothetical protein
VFRPTKRQRAELPEGLNLSVPSLTRPTRPEAPESKVNRETRQSGRHLRCGGRAGCHIHFSSPITKGECIAAMALR